MERHPEQPTTAVPRDMAAELWKSAAAVLDADGAYDHMAPSRRRRPEQRSWDTAFLAIGLAYVNPTRAWRDLRGLFRDQWPDGRVPHGVPGPRTVDGHPCGGDGLVRPPLHAVAAWEVYRRSAAHGVRCARQARDELAWLYPRLVAQQRYLTGARDAGGTGLASIVHPSESGLDDSPFWDAAMAGVPRRPAGADHARHAELVRSYRAGGHADSDLTTRHPFVVQCPAFNAIMGAAEVALAKIAEELGADAAAHRERARRITTAIVDRLWDPQTRTFRARDVRTGMLSPARCVGGLVPLILPGLPPEHAAAVVAEAGSARFGLPGATGLPVPSYDRTARDFDALRPWRGPIGINVNWLLRRGMLEHGRLGAAEDLRVAMLRLVHRSGAAEHYHPDSGEGIGEPAFSGTAALALDLLADRSVPAYARV